MEDQEHGSWEDQITSNEFGDIPGYTIDRINDNRCQSISIKGLLLIINDQSMAKIRVVIDYRLSIPID